MSRSPAKGAGCSTMANSGRTAAPRCWRATRRKTGPSIWNAVLSPGTVLTRPGTGDFLVASRTHELSRTRVNSTDTFEDVWLVSADGSARILLKHAAPLQIRPADSSPTS